MVTSAINNFSQYLLVTLLLEHKCMDLVCCPEYSEWQQLVTQTTITAAGNLKSTQTVLLGLYCLVICHDCPLKGIICILNNK